MGYMLLWIESLATSLLLVALVLACVARLPWRWMREALWLPVGLVPLGIYGGLTALLAAAWWGGWPVGQSVSRLLLPLLALTVCYFIGAVWLRLRALRPAADDPAQPVAAGWPRAGLGTALAVVAALHLMTFWNLDLAVRQRVAALRSEAGALALSVAPARVPDRDNAALVYQQAFEAMGLDQSWPGKWQEDWQRWTAFEEDSIDPDDPRLKEFLEENEPVLMLLRHAGGKSGCYFDRDYGRPSIGMLLPELSQLRSAARLLALDARRQAAVGDRLVAMRDIDTLYAMAEHAASDPILICLLVGIAIDQTANGTLEAVLASGPITAEELAELEISDSMSYRPALERSFRMEQAFGASVFCDVALGEVGLQEIQAITSGETRRCNLNLALPYRLFLVSDDLAAHRRFMQEYRALATKPYYQTKDRWENVESQLASDPGGVLTATLLPALGRAAQLTAQGEARRNLARLAVAMLRYHAEHGQYPEPLDDLVPAQIPFIPRDPFDGKPIKLRKDEGQLILYSLGPDLVDNGGAQYDRKERTGDLRFVLPE